MSTSNVSLTPDPALRSRWSLQLRARDVAHFRARTTASQRKAQDTPKIPMSLHAAPFLRIVPARAPIKACIYKAYASRHIMFHKR